MWIPIGSCPEKIRCVAFFFGRLMLNSQEEEELLIKIEPREPLELPQPTKFEFLEFLVQTYYWYEYSMGNASLDYLYDYYYDDLDDKLKEYLSKSIFKEYFNGDWRKGHEFHKIRITHRLYQISSTATQA